jgi:protein-S-isoprenylcysteine O-methyltransferase Ste14
MAATVRAIRRSYRHGQVEAGWEVTKSSGGMLCWDATHRKSVIVAVLFAPRLDGHAASWLDIAVIAGGALCLVGLGFVLLGSFDLGRNNLSAFPKPRDNSTLVTSGIFSIVRHPIYSGFIFLSFGWSLIWGSVAAFVAALALLIFFDLKARREERWLEAKFSSYAAYKQHIKKLIPFVY